MIRAAESGQLGRPKHALGDLSAASFSAAYEASSSRSRSAFGKKKKTSTAPSSTATIPAV